MPHILERKGELLQEAVGEILKPLRKQFPRLCAYEEELVRYHCAGYYQAAICQLCQDMWPEIVASEAFGKLPKTKDFLPFLGHTRGRKTRKCFLFLSGTGRKQRGAG